MGPSQMLTSRTLLTTNKSRHFFSFFQRHLCLQISSHDLQPQRHNHARPTSFPHCERCQHPKVRFVATSTTATSESQKATHYTLFPRTLPTGPPPEGPFTINLQALKSEFLLLQAKAHPDRHSGPDKARAEGTSALINEAYKTLSSPLLRTQYLLHLHEIDVAEDESAKIDDEELLMEVLEAREAIEGAQEEEELEGVKSENEGRIEKSERVVEALCVKGEWEAVKDEAIRLRYWVNIREALQGWEKGKPVVIHH